MKVDGKTYNKNWLSHQAIMDGMTIDYDMSETPNKSRGTKKSAYPYSLSNE